MKSETIGITKSTKQDITGAQRVLHSRAKKYNALESELIMSPRQLNFTTCERWDVNALNHWSATATHTHPDSSRITHAFED